MKNKHRIKQGLSLLLAGGIALTNLGAALPAFAEDAAATPETASAATPETAEANVPTPNLSQITENLYDDLPDAPTGSYLGSMGLPVATGETKIGISAWVSDLYDGVDAHMDADALNADENTVTIGKTPGTDYAIVPLLAQVEYPADGAVSEIILPDGVELLSYLSTDYEPIPADEQEQAEILHQTYSEQSAAATGLYVKASADFTAQLVYTDSDGSSQSKAIQVQISEDVTPTQMYADTGDDGIAAYAAGPTPPYTTGKITSIAKEGGTWLIWFNGQEAYCCSHGLNGQPKGCPTYSYLLESFNTQFIGGLSFGYSYNNQRRNLNGNATNIRFNLETAGNLIDGVEHLFFSPSKSDKPYYTIFGIPYAQYFRTDLSVSRKIMLGGVTALVGHIYGGVAMAYGNSSSVPFDRQFYCGGSNGMRGWTPRTLGQGSVPDPHGSFPVQTGDVKLEANLELRFPVWGIVHGATFFDLGNVWYIRQNPSEYSDDAVFHFDRFYKQLGFNTGLGLRFDIKFAVLRLDWGIQLHNPNNPAGERWIHDFKWKNTALNFGVGYPF